MDFSKLKNMAKSLGGILVVNGNDPDLVILSYDKFEVLEAKPSNVAIRQADSHKEDEMIDLLNKEILALKEEIRQKELAEAQVV